MSFPNVSINRLAEKFFREHENVIHRRTDRTFAVLMILQYLAGILAAIFVSPNTWGSHFDGELQIRAAIFLGAIILAPPVTLAIFFPGRRITRHFVAIGQALDSALLIHLCGGRIETHFHIFGSLAFLGFYRDWRVLVSASVVIVFDHYYRGTHWPLSVYGVAIEQPFRWLEHAGWILFEDVFIILATNQSRREMREIALRRAYVEQVAVERGRDIHALEEAKRQLNDALESKDAFMSICGHELKTPLTSLNLQAQIAKRALASENAERETEKIQNLSRKLIEQTESQVKRLLRLVQDLLDHSRIQMGKLPITPETVEVAALLREVIERYREQAETSGSKLLLRIQEGIVAHWDRFRIEQVITNLLSNAIKYGDGKEIEITFSAENDVARISIRDHGIGIATPDHGKIFRQFERLHHHTHIAGLGLGLYISRSIVERHRGQLRFESEKGNGALFWIEIPLRPYEMLTEKIS